MKKIISIILVTGTTVSLAACGSTDTAESTEDKQSETEQVAEQAEGETDTAWMDEDGNIIIDRSHDDVSVSYFEENNMYICDMEYGKDFDRTMKTAGDINEYNDCLAYCTYNCLLNEYDDEEEGYIDTVFFVTDKSREPIEYYGEDELPEAGLITTHRSDDAYDYYTGASLFTKGGVVKTGIGGESGEIDYGQVTVILPDGSTGIISSKTDYGQNEAGNSYFNVTIKHPAEYDGIVFEYSPAMSAEDAELGTSDLGFIHYPEKTTMIFDKECNRTYFEGFNNPQ